MRAFDLAIESWGAGFDVDMLHTQVLHMPVELGLEFMAVIGPDHFDPERKLIDNIIDKVDRVLLGMAGIDFQRPDSGGVIDRGVLKAFDPVSVFIFKEQEFDVDLHMVARYLFLIALELGHGSLPAVLG